MKERLKLLFFDKIAVPNTENKSINGLLNVLAILVYPVIIIVGVVIMILVLPLSIWQNITKTKAEKQQEIAAEENMINIQNQWAILSEDPRLTIYQKFAGELPGGSGYYLYLNSTPAITYFDEKIFGDWLLVDFDGIFLQRWHHDRRIDCDLVFIAFDTLEITLLKQHIPSKFWRTRKLSKSEIEFTFSVTGSNLIYIAQQPS